jgi:DNA-binding protein H-NS
MEAPSLDLTPYSIEELEALGADVQKRIAELRQEKRRQAFQQLDSIAKELGLSKDDLAARYARASRARPNGPGPQYANPANPEQTWTGKGRKPAWVRDYLKAGKSLEDLRL